MLFLRSVAFMVFFYGLSAILCITLTPLFLLPRSWTVAAMRFWARMTMWLLKVLCGLRYEIRGTQYQPTSAVLIASKHQSMWDTIIYLAILKDPAIVLKKELLMIPYYGWFSLKARMIPIDRKAAASALRKMLAKSKAAMALGRSLIIFPEGTRAAPGAKLDYKPGVAALYGQLEVPCVPVALNSGLYWPRRSIIRRPGTIILEFLPPVAPGLKRKEFLSVLAERIETATDKLVTEGLETLPPETLKAAD